MRSFLLFAAVAMVVTACDKPEEKRAPDVTAPNTAQRQIPSPSSQSVTQHAKPATPAASPEELAALTADYEMLAKQVDALKQPPADGKPQPDADLLHDTYRTLNKRHTELMAGMTLEQKKELGHQLRPFKQRIVPLLTRHRLDRIRERSNKPLPPTAPPPGSTPVPGESRPARQQSPDGLLDLLKENPEDSASDPPGAPASGAPVPQ